jgi:glyoxylase-like metal-dependent hydrolase (beta-lactamase superfamily II)
MAEEVLQSIYRVVVPLPGSPLKEVNSYVITAADRNLVIDTGMNRPECLVALEAGLAEIGVDLDRTDFLATHLHADHHGLIPTLLRHGRRAFMGAIDAGHMRHGMGWSTDSPMGRYMARSGFPADDLIASFQNHPGFKFRPDRVVHYEPLHEGDLVEIGPYRLRVIDTPGHTHGHISLYDPEQRLFIAGDHVLGDITPNIQAWSDDDDPLADYLDSLEKVETLDVELCLPGHRRLIHQFKKRTRELAEHHHERAAEIVDVLDDGGPRNAYDTAARMTWDIVAKSWEDFPIMQRWFATGEAIAHLRFLEEQGRVTRCEHDGDQILYAAAGAA